MPVESSPPSADHARVAPRDRFLYLPQALLPQRLLTRLVYWLTRVRTPWFKNFFIRGFVAAYGVDLLEAAEPNPTAYRDFNQFFTRPLRDGARPLPSATDAVCCPVDGRISQIGFLTDDRLLQAKDRTFSLAQLLGDEARARPFRDGGFVTLYLSPRDYHRIHMPVAGALREMAHIPGRLFSVSPLSTRVVDGVFARNERVAAVFDSAAGPLAVVLVGALNVASIETVWAGAITPPLGTVPRAWSYPASGAGAVILERGTELGRFNMGSTVILVFARDRVRWATGLAADSPVRMGQSLGQVVGA